MGFKISKFIYELLQQYGQVKIPGLGTFVSHYQASVINESTNSISPPTTKTNFRSNPNLDKGILLKHIMNSTEMDSFTASKFISEQVDLIKVELDKSELVYLNQIGHLYKNHLNKMVFLPEKTNFDSANFHLPELELQPITDAEMAEVKSLIKKPRKSKFKLPAKISTLAPIAAMLVACVLFVSLMLNRDTSKVPSSDFQKIPVRVNEKPSYTPPVVEPKKDIDGEYETEIDTEAATFGPKTNECVIIVGQFKSKDGARKRVSQIYDFGYDAFTDQYNGLNRVGVQFAYENESQIQEMLKKVQARFDRNAWVLKQ